MPLLGDDTVLGREFRGRSKKVTEERVFAFSGGFPRDAAWPKKNIHTDLDFARSCGLEMRVASGAMCEGYLAELMVDLFGEDWLRSGKMSLVFIAAVEPGDRVVAKSVAMSRESDDGGDRYLMDVWCENQKGAKVVIGTASGVLVHRGTQEG